MTGTSFGQVFSTESGFTLRSDDELDIDRFDDHCDHLVVREDHTGELVGCYRMLPPPGAIAAGGLYSAGEFDISALDTLRPFMVEMGRAVVRADHRNGAVILKLTAWYPPRITIQPTRRWATLPT